MREVFVDTGAFYAALNRKDRNHRAAVGLFDRALAEEWRLITSNFVVAETHALVLIRLGRDFAAAWLRSIPPPWCAFHEMMNRKRFESSSPIGIRTFPIATPPASP